MNLKRVMIAAPKSGSGKTMVTCALLQVLKDMGQQAVSYKCGPDYIDPMFHQKVIGISSKNLDTFFTGEKETRTLFLKNRTEEDFAVLEGVMGLFDGLGGIRKEGSSYHLAQVTKTPIILVVDAKGMGRSVIPLLAGFLAYDRDKLIRGVILNRMSKAYYETIKPLIEEKLHIRVIGFLPEQKQFHVESRHLGLKLPEELSDIREQLKALSEEFQKTVSLEEIIHIAKTAEELEFPEGTKYVRNPENESMPQDGSAVQEGVKIAKDGPVIAVAKDEAFCFYYEDNLLMLQENGAQIKYFSPLYDTKLPENCCGLLIGGGYPELYAEELSKNKKMLEAIRNAIHDGMPVVAECGGFMYLHSVIMDKEEKEHTMVGIIPSVCRDTGKLVRFGYIELEEKQSCFLPEGERIKGHEFHYFDSEDNGSDCLAVRPVTGKSYPCVISGENYWLGFPHLYYPSNPVFAKSFAEKAVKRKNSTDKRDIEK